MERNSERTSLEHCTVHSSAVKLEKMEPSPQESQDMKVLQIELEKFAKLLKQKGVPLGYTQADMGLTLGVLFGEVFSQTTIRSFKALQLSFKNLCKLRLLLEKWVEEAHNNENLQGGMQTLVQACKRKQVSIENPEKGNLKNTFLLAGSLPCSRSASSPNSLAGEGCGSVWFCNLLQKGKQMIKH